MRFSNKVALTGIAVIAFWVVVLIVMCCMSGCTKSLHVKSGIEVSVTASVDTTIVKAKVTDSSGYSVQEYSETTAAIPGSEATIELEAADLLPVTDANGVLKGRQYTAESAGGAGQSRTRAKVTVHSNGSVRVDCKTDSLLALISRYRKDSAWQQLRTDSALLLAAGRAERIDSLSWDREEVWRDPVRVFGTLRKAIWWLLVGFVAGYVFRIWMSKKFG